MHLLKLQRWRISEILIALFVFLIISFYTYALWVLDPYPGFAFNNSNGRIVEVYTRLEQKTPTLQVDDVLFKIGPVSWETYQTDATVLLFEGIQTGDIVEITVIRNGKKIVIPWQFMGFDQNVLETRLINIWFLSFLFWIAGTTAIVLIRPRDLLRNLFIAINYLTAMWLIFGMLSHSHIWLSSILLHASTWLLLPVYLHFHWIFPRPLKQLSKTFVVLFYLLCSCFAIAELFQVLPKSLYAFVFLIALLGSFILQGIHFRKHKEQQRDIKLIAIAIGISFLPPIVLGILIATNSASNIAAFGLFTLPFMPLIYFYAIYRRAMGGLEIRLNRIISLYLFFIIFGIALFLIVIPLTKLEIHFETFLIINMIAILAIIYIAIATFPKFQNFVERRYLGIKLDSQTLQEEFISRIIASTSLNNLLQVLEEDVFPSLLIRQYAFMQNTNGNLKALLTRNVSASEMPDETATNSLLERSGEFIPDVLSDDWMRLILPLQVGDSLFGFFLLGQRDPDDLYHQTEIPILQTVTNQTAIAFSNSLHAEQLKQMYELGTERYESERSRFARDLHDVVLNGLGEFRRNLFDLSPTLEASYQKITDGLHEIISDLRPQMLLYGVTAAIQSFAENLMQKTNNTLKVNVALQTAEERLPENIELHLFRIVEQASNNSLLHGKASTINISGVLSPEKVDLLVEDDGIGFEIEEKWELGTILASHHFGLIGMIERAHIIDATLNIQSQPNRGTKIQILWSAKIH